MQLCLCIYDVSYDFLLSNSNLIIRNAEFIHFQTNYHSITEDYQLIVEGGAIWNDVNWTFKWIEMQNKKIKKTFTP